MHDGSYPFKEEKLKLISTLDAFQISDEVAEIADVYMRRKLMPKELYGDAIHLAVASLESCHFLLPWNCRHLANANKFEHIRYVNTTLGLYVPIITTPAELFSDDEENEI